MVIALVFWATVSRVINKIPTYFVGGLVLIVGLTLMYLIDSDIDLWVVGCSLVLVGIGTAAGYLIINALIPDVISMDENVTGKRREAIYYSLFSFIGKASQGTAQLLGNYSLQATHYVTPSSHNISPIQPESVATVLTLLVSLVPLAMRLLGFFFGVTYVIVARKYSKPVYSIENDA